MPVGWYDKLKDTDKLTIIPYDYTITGHPEVSYALGKKSGMPSIEIFLRDLGLSASAEQRAAILDAVKRLSLEKKDLVTAEEFELIARGIGAVAIGQS